MSLLCCCPLKKASASSPSHPTAKQSASTPAMSIIKKIAGRLNWRRSERKSSDPAPWDSRIAIIGSRRFKTQPSQAAFFTSRFLRRIIGEHEDWFFIEQKGTPDRRSLAWRLTVLGWTYDVMMKAQSDPSYSEHIQATRQLYFSVLTRAEKAFDSLESL